MSYTLSISSGAPFGSCDFTRRKRRNGSERRCQTTSIGTSGSRYSTAVTSLRKSYLCDGSSCSQRMASRTDEGSTYTTVSPQITSTRLTADANFAWTACAEGFGGSPRCDTFFWVAGWPPDALAPVLTTSNR